MNDPGQLEIDFGIISTFLTLFELGTRLTADGMRLRTGQTALERLAEFDQGRAFVLSAWLFPALLPLILQGAKPADRDAFSDPARLRDLAMAALDDDKWAKKQAELLARQQQDGRPQAQAAPPTAGSDKLA